MPPSAERHILASKRMMEETSTLIHSVYNDPFINHI